MTKRALVTGITGQDGSYLAELLLEKGYQVYGMVRRSSANNLWRIEHILPRLVMVCGDMTDPVSLDDAVRFSQPDEVYNLAAQSFVPASWPQPLFTGETNAIGVAALLEAVRRNKPDAKFYQASSSEMFGKVLETPQRESTPFYPRSPYGVSKVYGHHITVNYRESYGMFACSGILFNHESPRRGLEFVTRKVSHTVAKIAAGKAEDLRVGNLNACRDWGFAADYVKAMWMMLQQTRPDDFVIGTGEQHSVRDLITTAFALIGIYIAWVGDGHNEVGVEQATGKVRVSIDPALMRPAEVETLLADPGKARNALGWAPSVDFKGLIGLMLEADLTALKGVVVRQ